MARWLLILSGTVLVALSFSACSGCDDTPSGRPCYEDADCEAGDVCYEGRCTDPGKLDGGDGWDGGGWDGGGLARCEDRSDCASDEQCFNGYCVEVTGDPNCLTGDEDDCQDDTYCEPALDGCVPWEAHPDPEPACEHIPPEGEFTPVEEWVWQNPSQAPAWNQVMMTPVVVDLSGTLSQETFAVPAVLFNSFNAADGYSQNGILRAVRGDTGEPIFSVTDPAHYTHPVSNIAAGDLDGDGLVEIVTGKNGGRDLICFGADGSFRWATDTDALSVGWGGPAIANIDGLGPPEIVMGAAVINADGTVRWMSSGSRGDNYAQAATAPFSVPLDVNGDGLMEIITGDTLYAHDGTVIWDTGYGDGFVAVAEFGSGGNPEIVVVSRGTVRVQAAATGEIIWLKNELELNALPECDPNCGLLGPPTVADFDGDGLPEIGVAGADVYLVLDTYGGTPLWSVAARDSSSNITGSAVFDFEGDRRAEVVYADEESLRVFRGSDGTVLYSQPHSSLTACEYPVIADVDGDSNAEIIIAQNDQVSDVDPLFAGVRVFGDAQDNWVNTRRIWNQHAYHVTNVGEDGSIPIVAEKNWELEELNNFRQNVQPTGLFNAPDLTVRGLGYEARGCTTAGVMVYFAVSNRGLAVVPPGVPVAFYLGDPGSGGTLLGVSATTGALFPGQSELVAFLWADPPVNVPAEIWARVDDDGTGGQTAAGLHSECREDNNLGYLLDVTCLPES